MFSGKHTRHHDRSHRRMGLRAAIALALTGIAGVALAAPTSADRARDDKATTGAYIMPAPMRFETIKGVPSKDRPMPYGEAIAIGDVGERVLGLGQWQQMAGGWMRWTWRVSSPGAKGMELSFRVLELPPSATLTVTGASKGPTYSVTGDEIKRASYRSPLVLGDVAVVTIDVAEEETSALKAALDSVTHAYRTPFDAPAETAKSATCHNDVACTIADEWNDHISSVGMYTFMSAGLSYSCTGTLLGNTNDSSTPYFLTARHCLSTNAEAATVTVYWNFQNWFCRASGSASNGTPLPPVGTASHSQSGAVVRATYSATDMTLLQLDTPPSAYAAVYMAGWDRGGVAPTSTVSIHHAQGDEKRFTQDLQAPAAANYYGAAGSGSSHWRVGAWNSGSTEVGSSGAPLFDNFKKVIGQLHGGDAACGNAQPDWFGRLSRSWTGGGTNATRLSNWLDPAGVAPTSWAGYYPTTVSNNRRGTTSDLAIPDNATVERSITIAGMANVNGTAASRVRVRLSHTHIGDLKVDLVAPNGLVYTLHNRTDTTKDNLYRTYIVNTTGAPRNGLWKLRINDNAAGDTGALDAWSIQF